MRNGARGPSQVGRAPPTGIGSSNKDTQVIVTLPPRTSSGTRDEIARAPTRRPGGARLSIGIRRLGGLRYPLDSGARRGIADRASRAHPRMPGPRLLHRHIVAACGATEKSRRRLWAPAPVEGGARCRHPQRRAAVADARDGGCPRTALRRELLQRRARPQHWPTVVVRRRGGWRTSAPPNKRGTRPSNSPGMTRTGRGAAH